MDAEPQPDPFKFFAEQEASYWASSKYRDRLVELARQLFAATGDSAGGLVACAGAPLGKVLAQAAPADRRPDPERQDCVTAMPRPDFDGFVRLHAPNAFSALPEPDPEWKRLGRTLPVLVDTANGYRLTHISYDVD